MVINVSRCSSPSKWHTSGSFSAVAGYDLVTGWGSPNAGLINALAPQPSAITIWQYTGTPCSGSSVRLGDAG